MSLTTLQNKKPKDVLKLLSVVSNSLLPNPSLDLPVYPPGIQLEAVNSVISEIRQKLNISENDQSISAQSKIFSYISKEISNVALDDENIKKVKKRLGSRGELPLNQYRFVFDKGFNPSEILGEKKSNAIEVLKKPDKYVHFSSRYLNLNEEMALGVSLFTKLIVPKKSQDKFINLIICSRIGDLMIVLSSLRAYFTEMKLSEFDTPEKILKEFVNTYGFTFKIGDLTSKLIQNNVTELGLSPSPKDLVILDGESNERFLVMTIANESNIFGTAHENSRLSEIILSFVLNISNYAIALEKHHIRIGNEVNTFPKIK